MTQYFTHLGFQVSFHLLHMRICYCGIQACDECVHRTLIILIRMEIKWLHDGNLEEEEEKKAET